MRIMDVINETRSSMNAREVFGQPYEKNGLTIIPAARVTGSAGGGGDQHQPQAGGMGLGIMAQPAGAFVIKGDEVTWQPALDLNRIIFMGQLVGIIALLTIGTIARSSIQRQAHREPGK